MVGDVKKLNGGTIVSLHSTFNDISLERVAELRSVRLLFPWLKPGALRRIVVTILVAPMNRSPLYTLTTRRELVRPSKNTPVEEQFVVTASSREGEHVGHVTFRRLPEGDYVAVYAFVSDVWRRSGVTTAMYDEAERAGLTLTPAYG